MNSILSIFRRLRRKAVMYKGGETFLNYLRKQGCSIGSGCYVASPSTVSIDCSRPYLIEIGNNVRLNRGLTILTHDFSSVVFKQLYGEMLPSSGKVKIGNNVYFGWNCTVLKGVTIGDNCIIGYGSVVTRDIPANSVAAGSPAKVICSIDDYYTRRKRKSLEESLELAREINVKLKRRPVPADFKEEFVWFVDGNDIDRHPDIPIKHQLRVGADCLDRWKSDHKKTYEDFDEFLNAAGL